MLFRAQQILLDKGLFDPHLADRAYNHEGPAKSRPRAGLAWEMLSYPQVHMFSSALRARSLTKMPSIMELCTTPSPTYINRTAGANTILNLRVGKDDWSPWPLTRPNLPAHTDEIIMARAQLGVIMRDMAELQRKHGTTAMDKRYVNALTSMHRRYQDWMNSLEYGLQSCEFASQQLLLI